MPEWVYNTGMIKHYTLEDKKPVFHDGDYVIVDLGRMTGAGGLLPGKIVGRTSEHVIDHWMVQFKEDFGVTYPFRVVSVFHTAIVKDMPLNEVQEMLEKSTLSTLEQQQFYFGYEEQLKR